jgi:hypothetical protein
MSSTTNIKLQEFIQDLQTIYLESPNEYQADLCLFVDRHRGYLLTTGGLRDACPIEIGCRGSILRFCPCVCENQTPECKERLRLLVQTCRMWEYHELNQRSDRIMFVKYLDQHGSNIFK